MSRSRKNSGEGGGSNSSRSLPNENQAAPSSAGQGTVSSGVTLPPIAQAIGHSGTEGSTSLHPQPHSHPRNQHISDPAFSIKRTNVQQQQARPTGLISAAANAGPLGLSTAPSGPANRPPSGGKKPDAGTNGSLPSPSAARRMKLPSLPGDQTQTQTQGQNQGESGQNAAFSNAGALMPSEMNGQAPAVSVEIQVAAEQRLAMEILMDGFVQAYVDFFYLVNAQRAQEEQSKAQAQKLAAEDPNNDAGVEGNASAPLPALSVEDLIFMRRSLTDAEKARRLGDAVKVYEAFKNLADFFDGRNDFKTSVQFYQKCLDIAREMENIAAEGQANQSLGKSHEKHKELGIAISYYEECLLLAKKEQSSLREKEAMKHLIHAYRIKAEESEGSGDYNEAVSYLKKCAEMARSLDDRAAEGACNYRLGLASEHLKDMPRALQFFENYYHTALQLRDETGQATACAALARVCTTMKDQTKSIMYLEMLLDIGQRTNQASFQAEACGSLGVLFNKQNDYEKSVFYFEKYFEIARSMESRKMLDSARIQLGVSRANARIASYTRVVLGDMKGLLGWKNLRQNFEQRK